MKRTAFCLFLIFVLSLTGCSYFRQPSPGNPGQEQQPNNSTQPPPTSPGVPQPPNSPGQPGVNQGNVLGQETARNISARAMENTGVRNATAIVIGNMAIVGLELQNGIDSTHTQELVAEDTEQNFSEIESAYVTSEVDLVDKISATSDNIAQGRPTAELMDDIFQIWERVRP